MADTRRTWAQLDALFPDNTAGAIGAQDLRDGFTALEPHSAAAAPTINDDDTSGFDKYHGWIDTSTTPDSLYICLDGSTGAAVWVKVYPTTASVAWGGITGTLADQTDLQTALDAKGGGDMLKATYDSDDDGKVDVAERVEEAVATDADSTATHAIDCDTGTVHQVTLTANCTLSFSNVPSGGFGITLELIQDATGSRTVTWPAAVTWAGGTAPTLTTTAAAIDVVTLYTPDGGTTWRGFLAGLAFS